MQLKLLACLHVSWDFNKLRPTRPWNIHKNIKLREISLKRLLLCDLSDFVSFKHEIGWIVIVNLLNSLSCSFQFYCQGYFLISTLFYAFWHTACQYSTNILWWPCSFNNYLNHLFEIDLLYLYLLEYSFVLLLDAKKIITSCMGEYYYLYFVHSLNLGILNLKRVKC